MFWTTIAVSLTALLALILAFMVVQVRRAEAVGIGHRDNRRLELRIRAHANLIEYAVFALPLIALLEYHQAPSWLLATVTIGWVVGRMLHPWGLIAGAGRIHIGRVLGTLASWLTMAIGAIANLVLIG
ncbi:MAPEG family protein [Ferrimonas senticii]|uniref:MAPEG family protein n=1 Tax=Ferrimonas senticii TaxID=394566 RepID=UPI00042962D5|nr:MAPEG family protein [Ferrimonas senticii]